MKIIIFAFLIISLPYILFCQDTDFQQMKNEAHLLSIKLPTEKEIKKSNITFRDKTIITSLKSLCEKIKAKHTFTIQELININIEIKSALNPEISHAIKEDDNKNKNNQTITLGSSEGCINDCSSNINSCIESSDQICLDEANACNLSCIIVERIAPEIEDPITHFPENDFVVYVNVEIVKIYCRSVDDGRNDKAEEVYGRIWGLPGNMCYDGDVERYPPKNVKGLADWSLKAADYSTLKKGKSLSINKKASWEYTLPPSCNNANQSVVDLFSNLDERDEPNDDDDKLSTPCGIYGCSENIYLAEIPKPGKKTFNVVQTHSSGGTTLEVIFKVKVKTKRILPVSRI